MKKAELINKWQEKAKWCFESMKMNEDNSEYKRELAAKIDVYNDVILDIKELEEPEQEKVVIPQFVANEIERYDNMLDMLSGEYFNSSFEEIDDDSLLIWIDENQETFARAWLDGYSVEEEKLYKIKLSKYDYLVQDEDGTIFTMDTNLHEYKDTFTEQEIKAIDERFWTFEEEITK